MKTILLSIFVMMVFATASMDAESVKQHSQTLERCLERVKQQRSSVVSSVGFAGVHCSFTCSSKCKSLLVDLKDNFGCCLEKTEFSGALDVFSRRCGVELSGVCSNSSSSASNVAVSFFTVIFNVAVVTLYCE